MHFRIDVEEILSLVVSMFSPVERYFYRGQQHHTMYYSFIPNFKGVVVQKIFLQPSYENKLNVIQ